MTKEKKYTIAIISGVLLILLGSFYYFSGMASNLIGLLFINLGIILVVIKTLQFNKFGAGVKQDERTRKISTRGISYSWLTTFVFLNILFWIDVFQIINLDLSQGISLIFFVMIISAVVFKALLKNKEV